MKRAFTNDKALSTTHSTFSRCPVQSSFDACGKSLFRRTHRFCEFISHGGEVEKKRSGMQQAASEETIKFINPSSNIKM